MEAQCEKTGKHGKSCNCFSHVQSSMQQPIRRESALITVSLLIAVGVESFAIGQQTSADNRVSRRKENNH